MEKRLREQGFRGNSYRFLIGDSKEMAAMAKEANSKPITFSNDIASRVMPFLHQSVQKHGSLKQSVLSLVESSSSSISLTLSLHLQVRIA